MRCPDDEGRVHIHATFMSTWEMYDVHPLVPLGNCDSCNSSLLCCVMRLRLRDEAHSFRLRLESILTSKWD